MKPKTPDNQPDLFRSQLSQILNLSHPLCRLSTQIDWQSLEHEIDQMYTDGPGQPALPTRLLVGLHYLKYTFNESDESVVDRWIENPYWQYFCGYEYLQHKLPLHPTSLVKWRKRMGKQLEKLLSATIEVGVKTKAIKSNEFRHVNVDTTVHEKAVAFPTDARLYQKMRLKLVKAAKSRGIILRQSYARVSKKSLLKQGRYAHARQMKRARRETRKLRTYLGRVIRDIDRKTKQKDQQLESLLNLAHRLFIQQRQDKNKIYSIHAPEVRCISKGKAHKRYEFGNKASFVTTSKSNWIVSAQHLEKNPYDGHSLSGALQHMKSLTGFTPQHAYCDRGYRGHGYQGETEVKIVGRIPKKTSWQIRRWMKRRASIEPTIGHLKSDHRLNRNYLHGEHGDRANVVLAAAGYNLAKLIAWFYCARRILTHFYNNSGFIPSFPPLNPRSIEFSNEKLGFIS